MPKYHWKPSKPTWRKAEEGVQTGSVTGSICLNFRNGYWCLERRVAGLLSCRLIWLPEAKTQEEWNATFPCKAISFVIGGCHFWANSGETSAPTQVSRSGFKSEEVNSFLWLSVWVTVAGHFPSPKHWWDWETECSAEGRGPEFTISS